MSRLGNLAVSLEGEHCEAGGKSLKFVYNAESLSGLWSFCLPLSIPNSSKRARGRHRVGGVLLNIGNELFGR